MSRDHYPCEGSIFVMSYTECDYEGEDTAALVFILENGRLRSLLGVMNLPNGASFNTYGTANYDRALQIVRDRKVSHVFTPQFDVQDIDFFGQKLGYSELTDEPNEKGEIECWCEFGAFTHNWYFISLLEEHQIKVIEINPETKEVIK